VKKIGRRLNGRSKVARWPDVINSSLSQPMRAVDRRLELADLPGAFDTEKKSK
jgi:hypothetical protein